MQNADQTITYFKLDENGRAAYGVVIRGVSWFEKTVSTVTDKGLLLAKAVSCRIPVDNLPVGFVAREEDMIVHGSCDAKDVSDTSLRHNHGAVTIKATHDNRRGCSPHWKLEAV